MMQEKKPVCRIRLEEVDSTNRYAKTLSESDEWQLVTAEFQTAGRGAGTNSWESERGENLLLSLVVRPKSLEASRAFALSEALSLAISDALSSYVEGVSIKWPNDIYCGQRKMTGILIENELAGTLVRRSILGVGLNVNQTRFVSDAPNPVSLRQVLGREVDREEVLERLLDRFSLYVAMLENGLFDELHQLYLSRLFRLGVEADYADADGRFRATITGVEPGGHLLLTDTEGHQRRYAFKEVKYE